MRVVVFTSQIANRTGGEINARDWALGLKSRGHKVVVYTPVAGPLAQEIRAAGVSLVDDPAAIRDAPDVMYGSGVHDLAALAARFPDVPIVQVSQQWDSWASFPSALPQVVLHVPVDELNAESLANEFGVPRERIRIVRNAVDLARVQLRRGPLPVRPRRALAFIKHATPYLVELRDACASRGIALECVGAGVENVIHDPFAAIAACDLVIGSARTALEGAASGAAVLVADHRGLGGLLTTQNHARFCAHNFGREVLTRPLDARAIGAEIDRYDAADAADVTKLVRDTASLERQLELLESVLGDAISLFRRSPATSDARQRALSSYLARHLPRHGEPSPRHAPQAGSEADPRVTHLDRQVSILTERLSALELERVLHAASPARAPSTASSNVLERSEALDAVLAASRIVAVERVDPGLEGCSTYLVRACGGDSEHYADHSVAASTGRWTFALDVREVSSPRARIQLLDTRANGVFGDFDFRREEICVVRVGQALRCNGGARAGGDGWYRLWITADLPPGDAEIRVVIQLLDRQDRFGFTPGGEAILIRCLQLEPGDRPTPYQPAPERQRAARSRWARLAGKLVARL